MLPQCDPAILCDNPQFKILHQQLTTSILNPDGSTRALDADPLRRHVRAELKKHQIRAAKRRILKRVVCQLPFDLKNDLPDELRDLVAIIALYLNHPSSSANRSKSDGTTYDNDNDADDTIALLEPDLSTFRSQLPNLLPAIRIKLTADIHHLKTLANATSSSHSSQPNESHIPQHTRSDSRLRPLSLKATSFSSSATATSQSLLSTQLSSRLGTLRTLQTVELPAAQRQLAVTGAEVLSAHTQVMERMIQVLERTKHGSLARAGKARAEYLAAVAEGLDGKVKVMQRDILSSIYTPETVDALQNYRKHLHDTRVRLEERERKALKELEVYEIADSSNYDDSSMNRAGAVVEIAKRYGSLVKEVEAVRMEIRRLGGNI
ncbi:hypothetical protein PRK78_006333 [Emydomyces testavorans]|uniref:HAUS augmin-like complex subunit 4 n=1 Tax=Emydomyces testavorans TaxID=2070801 RepID=A0AAF0DQ12_9EURO|nr:hypothetical protein PRK78_006333 [Emydomyces testavorans]